MSTCKATIILGKNDICKDCMKTDVCIHKANLDKDPIIEMLIEKCKYFKDRSKFIELPCKVGDLVYYITPDKTIRSMLVAQIFIDRAEKTIGDGGGIYFLFENFDKTVFLTKEEAEQALMEMFDTTYPINALVWLLIWVFIPTTKTVIEHTKDKGD